MFGYTNERGLFTDFYELTMAQGYFDTVGSNVKATFDLFFRSNPFNGGYTVACGIPPALEYLENFQFSPEELEYLAGLDTFSENFLNYLETVRFTGDVEAVKEGTIVFPQTPVLKVTAPLIEAQLVESALLNIINYSTLIATKAVRIVYAARGGKVVEFGLRRAQGDGAYLGTRAALIGGCVGTSFVDGARMWQCPPIGTQAHSWVQAFSSELEAFQEYAKVFPDNCLLLIDTYNVLESGLPNAVQVAKDLRKKGKKLTGVRIDSGDLAYLSIRVYEAFREAGFPDISIVLSNELDEYTITSIVNEIRDTRNRAQSKEDFVLKEETVKHIVYGVGTKLITGGDQAALGGVYKLTELDGKPRIKVSENIAKTINPGAKNVWRIKDMTSQKYIADVLCLESEAVPTENSWIRHPIDLVKKFKLPQDVVSESLLFRIMEKGKKLIETSPTDWQEGQIHVKSQLARLDPTYIRLLNPHVFKVSLSELLFETKMRMIKNIRQNA
ncbi:MAG: nicotinate phosphoribosyltransferase [Candidatus Thorarchaeota archaeon]